MDQEPPVDSESYARRYDKIFKENLEKAIPAILRLTVGEFVSRLRPQNVEMQRTRERKADFVGKAWDDSQGMETVLHLEFQIKNDPRMLYRMLEYKAMLRRKFPDLRIRQYVIAFGKNPPRMADVLDEPDHYYRYHLLWLGDIPYYRFLQSEDPEEVLLAVLADYSWETPEWVAHALVKRLRETSKAPSDFQHYAEQLRVLSNLRKLQPLIEIIMDKISEFFVEERDPLYRKGERKGKRKGLDEKARQVVLNLLRDSDFPPEKIAAIAGVPLSFVLEVQKARNSNA